MIFADQESKLLYEYYDPEQMKEIDLIIPVEILNLNILLFLQLCAMPLYCM